MPSIAVAFIISLTTVGMTKSTVGMTKSEMAKSTEWQNRDP
jgi:hypothetical protein